MAHLEANVGDNVRAGASSPSPLSTFYETEAYLFSLQKGLKTSEKIQEEIKPTPKGRPLPLSSFPRRNISHYFGGVGDQENCPLCGGEEVNKLRDELAQVTSERNALRVELLRLRSTNIAISMGQGSSSSGDWGSCGGRKSSNDDDEDKESLDDEDSKGEIRDGEMDEVEVVSDEVNDDPDCKNDGDTRDGNDELEDSDAEVALIHSQILPAEEDHKSSTYSSGDMTRLSSSSSSSSASSSPVLFPQQHQLQHQQQSNAGTQQHFHHSQEESVEGGFVNGGLPARDAALVIQRAYRRYSMVKEFQRIKTERRLSRRINNNGLGSANSPPINSCDICIEVHPEGSGFHSSQHSQDFERLEDGLEAGLEGVGQIHPLPQLTEEGSLPPQYAYLHQHSLHYRQNRHQHPYQQHQHQHLHQQQRQHSAEGLHPHSSSSSRIYPRQGPGHLSHSASGNLPHQQSLPHPLQYHNHNSAPSFHPQQEKETPVAIVAPMVNVSSHSTSSLGASNGNKSGGLSPEESEIIRKRLYRVGLNLFNKKPEVGVAYLVKKKFLEGSPPSVARFLVSRKGLSKQLIGEYLTNLQSPFSMAVLEHFVNEIDLSSLPVDLALRKFQSYYRMPGEAQKIERLMESFSRRYAACNPGVVAQFRNGADSVFVLAFAIIMLNTDLHTPALKAERRMKLDDFIKNLRGVDDGGDIPGEILTAIYDRIKSTEFKTGSDHVSQVLKVQQTIVGKKPMLAVPHRRLVCYCRLYEVPDPGKREKAGTHQREVFLFNDILVLTKIFHKKRNSVTYSFRQSYQLQGLTLTCFSNQYFDYGLTLKRGDETLLHMNARNDHDRQKFTEDLREAIAESDEMTRIELLAKENRDRDSGVDVGKMKRFSNSLLDINDQCKPVRRGSCGSLDSGMSVSFQSEETQHHGQGHHGHGHGHHPIQVSTSLSSASSHSTEQ